MSTQRMEIPRSFLWSVALGGLWLSAASAQPIVASFERFHTGETSEARLADGGLLLLNELNCVACHAAPEPWRERLPGRGKISLAGVGHRLPAEALRAFLANPHALKPGTVMPRIASTDAGATDALAEFLQSLPYTSAARSFPPGDGTRGRHLFESIGCAACHAPAETTTTTHPSVPLGLAAHYERNALADFVQHPLHTRPAGRMPATELSDAEAADLAAYLQTDRPNPQPAPPSVTHPRRDEGRAVFVARNCFACHDDGTAASGRAAVQLVRARLGEGCLAPRPPAAAPDFSLSAAQTRALSAALRALQSPPPAFTVEQRVAAKFEQLNCYACHEWRGRGGAEPARAKFFTASDSAVESLGELGRLPPKLDQAGRKLTDAWLAKLLWGDGGSVRPYLTARMPRFGAAAAGELVALLGEACRPPRPQAIDTSGSLGHQRFATGRQLIGTGPGGIGCVACHGLRDRDPPGIRAINLTPVAKRIRPEYFKALLLDPQGLQPGTIMPPLFASRTGADKEIESIWTYLKELEQNPRLPEGLAVAGALELKPEAAGRPIVFRTFLEGAGTHAIAVGFPARAHAAFDAFEVRWGVAWHGRFLDAMSNWEERMMPPVKPLGDTPRLLPPRMPLARLASAAEAWPATCGAAAGFIFKGYRLGPDGAPVFRYTVGQLEIEDVMRAAPDGASLRREFTVRGSGDGWFFRGLGDDAPRPVELRDGVAVFAETLSL